MRAHVGHCLAGDGRVEPPPRPHERLPVHRLLQVVDAVQHQRRLLRRAGLPGAEQVAVADELALQPVGDLEPLGEHVADEHVSHFGVAEERFQLREVAVFNDPRLVRDHVQAVLDRQRHEVDLGAVSPAEDDRVAGLLAGEPFEVVCAGAEIDLPRGRVVAARVERRDPREVRDGVAVERAVYVRAGVDAVHCPLQHQGRVEVTGRERHQLEQPEQRRLRERTGKRRRGGMQVAGRAGRP